MHMKRQKRHLAKLVMAVALAVTAIAGIAVMAPALAGPPEPAKGRGEKCVEPTDWMRRNHMKALMHKRDETVHQGIRSPKFSLKGCIDCHQVKGDDGKAVTAADPKHFCRTCHDYAAVRMDCFECHASRPEEKATTTGYRDRAPAQSGSGTGDVAALNRYLDGAGQ